MKMQPPLVVPISPDGYEVPEGGRTVGFVIEKVTGDITGTNYRILAAIIEKQEEKK
jgi:hypothetical protein